jgi:hypothetical protein
MPHQLANKLRQQRALESNLYDVNTRSWYLRATELVSSKSTSGTRSMMPSLTARLTMTLADVAFDFGHEHCQESSITLGQSFQELLEHKKTRITLATVPGAACQRSEESPAPQQDQKRRRRNGHLRQASIA